MASEWAYILVALFLDGLVGLTGGLLSEQWLRRHLQALVSFAAGALLGAVFLEIEPEVIHALGLAALTWTLAGFVALMLLEWALGQHHAHEEEPQGPKVLPGALLLSDALHNTGDGVAIAAAFLVSPRAGLAVALAVIAHEVPQEVGDYALLRASGWPRRSALLALAGVQLTAFLGAVGVACVQSLAHRATALLLALAGGTFLYIGATDLLPELRAGAPREKWGRLIGFIAGLALVSTLGGVG